MRNPSLHNAAGLLQLPDKANPWNTLVFKDCAFVEILSFYLAAKLMTNRCLATARSIYHHQPYHKCNQKHLLWKMRISEVHCRHKKTKYYLIFMTQSVSINSKLRFGVFLYADRAMHFLFSKVSGLFTCMQIAAIMGLLHSHLYIMAFI